MSNRQSAIVNGMSVDVEDYFQVSAFERHIPRTDWDRIPRRVGTNVDRILDLFAAHDLHATFFMLGWVAERHPEMVRRIVSAGHELASHGYEHVRVVNQDVRSFREDVARTKKILEDASGVRIRGYRAASYSIGAKNLWALDVLAETGHEYSSSIFPIHHDLYGMPEAPRFAFRHKGDGILEVPVTTAAFGDRKIPCGGGGWFRFFPYALTRWMLQRVNRVDRESCVFYFHPWEIDPGQPRQSGLPAKTRFRHYLNLDRMEDRLTRLIRDFRWDRMDRVFLEGRPAS
jgi:polysaccharide deacetylase family protein (PEP-CTERM system associated)